MYTTISYISNDTPICSKNHWNNKNVNGSESGIENLLQIESIKIREIAQFCSFINL